MTRPGETLIRTKIQELNDRITTLNAARDNHCVGPRTYRARRRWLNEDYVKLTLIAQNYGFEVGA